MEEITPRCMWACWVWIIWLMLLPLILAGCALGVQHPPPEVQARIEELLAELTAPEERMPDRYGAAWDLGEIGLDHPLPEEAISALVAAKQSPEVATEISDCGELGSGISELRTADAAQIAFWKWELRDMATDRERREFLWEKMADPISGNAVRDFCINRFHKMESPAVVPYLVAASTFGGERNWYVRRMATRRLVDFLPDTRDALSILVHSQDAIVASIARDALSEEAPPNNQGSHAEEE